MHVATLHLFDYPGLHHARDVDKRHQGGDKREKDEERAGFKEQTIGSHRGASQEQPEPVSEHLDQQQEQNGQPRANRTPWPSQESTAALSRRNRRQSERSPP